MATPVIQIDPQTGERINSAPASPAVQIDPSTGERVSDSQQNAFTPDQSNTLNNIKQAGIGAAKGLLHTATALPSYAGEKINSLMGYKQPEAVTGREQLYTPSNTAQSVGHGLEQAGEFLLPAGAEKAGAAKLASLAPRLGEYAAPIAKGLMSAGSTGAINAAQGGSFGAGALSGAAGAGAGALASKVAPQIAESAIGIRKTMRGNGREIGQAVLDETKGLSPDTIAESAKNKIGSLYDERQGILDAASSKPAPPIRGLLQAPQQEVPLSAARIPKATRGGLFPAEENQGWHLNQEGETVPGEYGYGNPLPKPEFLSGSAHPELSGRYAPPKGTLLSRQQGIGDALPTDEFGRVIHPQTPEAITPPTSMANRVASLAPARGVIGNALGEARGMEAPTLHRQLTGMNDFLHTGAVSGEPIPENITPAHLGRLQQGFSDEHLTWNPERHESANAAGKSAYGSMTGELERVAPETVPINTRISNLIPAKNAAESTSRNAPMLQKLVGRAGAHTGALIGAGIGATEGRREGGIPGMIGGGLTGLVAPELIATPEGQMFAARSLVSPAGRAAGKLIQGSTLQLNRKNPDQQ
jgi:hypothetical protein